MSISKLNRNQLHQTNSKQKISKNETNLLKKTVCYISRISSGVQWTVSGPVQALELRHARVVAAVAVTKRAGFCDKCVHVAVERG